MRGIKTKSNDKWKKLVVFFVLLLILILLINSVFKVYQKKKEAKITLEKMQADIESLKEREEILIKSIQRLETEEGIKFEMRKKLNVAEVGESVAIVVESAEDGPLPYPEQSILEKIKNFFQNIF